MNKKEKLKKLFGERKKPIVAYRSKVQQYATCPYAAWKSNDNRNVLMDTGDELHKLLEEIIKEAVNMRWTSEELAENFINEVISLRPDIQPQIIKAARFLADQLLYLRLQDVIGVEIQIDDAGKTGIKDLKGNPYYLSACLDLLIKGRDKSIHIWDWKSGFKKRTKEETFNDFQAQFDSNIIFKQYDGSKGDRIERVHWWFIETFWGTKSYACFERDFCYLPNMTLEQQISARIFEAIKLWSKGCRQAWPEEKKCSWCDVIMDCPFAHSGAKKIAGNPRKFIDQMVSLKASLDKRKSIAKYWMQRYGKVEGTEMVFDWRPSQRFEPRLYKLKGGE